MTGDLRPARPVLRGSPARPGPAARPEPAAGAEPPRARRAARRSAAPRPPTSLVADGRRYDVVRAWPRGRHHALLELTSGGATVAGQWFADGDDLAEAARRVTSPAAVAGDVLLQPAGADARLRALPGVLAEAGALLVSHRPGRRAVVALPGPGAAPRAFAKVVRPSRAHDLAGRGELVAELLDGVTVPRLLEGSNLEAGVLLWSVVPGRTLHDLGAGGDWTPSRAHDAWRAAGAAVTRLHDAPQDRVAARHRAEDELSAIAHWLDPAVAHGLLDPDLVARAGDRVTAALLADRGGDDLGVLHRDLHDKQLLLAGPVGAVDEGADDAGTGGAGVDPVGMIDVDTLAVGERALDLANAVVHLELRQAQGLLGTDLADAARAGLLAGAAATDMGRVADYADATRLRLAGVYAYRPRWRAVAAELLRRVADPRP